MIFSLRKKIINIIEKLYFRHVNSINWLNMYNKIQVVNF